MRPAPSALRQTMLVLTALAALSACDKIADSSNSAAAITGNMYQNARTTWVDAFTYHAPPPPNAPQTRYCYKNMDDIVCYDSVQPSLTAKLVGYQDGQNISWVQQGGGSLGASGGTPLAYQTNLQPVNTTEVIAVKTPIENDAGRTSYQRTGEIQSINLPPRGL